MPLIRHDEYRDGVLVRTWTDDVPADNADTLRTRAAAALVGNATYLALPTPTNAQVAAQVKALTRGNNALIRLIVGQLDDLTGT